MKIAAILFGWAVLMTAFYLLGRQWSTRLRSRERVLEPDEAGPPRDQPAGSEVGGFLGRWLFRAGYRGPAAAQTFMILTTFTTCLGMAAALLVSVSGLMREADRTLSLIPGGVGDILRPAVYLGPWIALVTLASGPTMVVRAARRKRVARIEQDLPLTLELLATLSEAGMGFDAALERVLRSQSADRPLTQEFRLFQMEILAGRPRIQCLRRLSWRVDVTSLTIFVSALVQTEQVGAGVADVLRRQADDLRGRRREQALTIAAALPVKLLFPLVICFLPGIMVATLGPTFYQIFQFMDGLYRSR